MRIMGCDIGGANTKIAVLRTRGGQFQSLETAKSYFFPFWERKEDFPNFISSVVAEAPDVDAVAATITAELADCFALKRDGIEFIVDSLSPINGRLHYLSVRGDFLDGENAKNKWLEVSASNWVATSLIVGQRFHNAILLDVGTTTTDIIPLKEGKPFTTSTTDLDRLGAGELVYTGVVRSNVAGIIPRIPVRGSWVPVANEFFACAGDVNVVLGHLNPDDYIGDTPDRRGKAPNECQARLARVVCADAAMLTSQEIVTIAQTVYDAQLDLVNQGLHQVLMRLGEDKPDLGVVTGLGGSILGKPVLLRAGTKHVTDLTDQFGRAGDIVSPAVCVAMLLGQKLEGPE